MESGLTTESDKNIALKEIEYYMQDLVFDGQTLSKEFASEEKTDVLLAAELTSVSLNMSCPASYGKSALYQWVVQVAGHTVKTNHMLCRSGEQAWEYPQCAPSACLDDQCKSCEEGWLLH